METEEQTATHDHTYTSCSTHYHGYQSLPVTAMSFHAPVGGTVVMLPNATMVHFLHPIILSTSQEQQVITLQLVPDTQQPVLCPLPSTQDHQLALCQHSSENDQQLVPGLQPIASHQPEMVLCGADREQLRPHRHHNHKTKRRRKNKELEMFSKTVDIAQRRQQVMLQSQWVPIPQDRVPCIPSVDILPPGVTPAGVNSPGLIPAEINNTTPTPTSGTDIDSTGTTTALPPGTTTRYTTTPVTPVRQRPSPLPVFEWADSREMWQTMMCKEELSCYRRDRWWFSRHSDLEPRMRTIVVDWLMQLAEECKLRRETFHVAVDFIDRFMSRTNNMNKHEFQLLAITALFVAAKVEEIRAVRVADLSYMSGGVCTEEQILQQERNILNVLKWDLTPISVVSWVRVFLQTISADQSNGNRSQFMTPQFSQHLFVQVMRLVDLCVLDSGSLQFSYSVLAAAAVYYSSSHEVALSVSGYQWTDIAPCVQWMSSFVTVLRQAGPTPVKFFDRVLPSETHSLQTHVINCQTLETVQRHKLQ